MYMYMYPTMTIIFPRRISGTETHQLDVGQYINNSADIEYSAHLDNSHW